MTAPDSTPLDQLPPRQRILRAAAMLFERSATTDVSTREVQRLAGVTAPTLYHHFKDKTGLVEAVIEDAFARYLAEKRESVAGLSPLSTLRVGWDLHVGFGLDQPVLYRLMYAPAEPRREVPAARMAREELRSSLLALRDAGLLVVPVDEAVALLEAAATGATLHLIRHGGGPDAPHARQLRDAVIARLTGTTREDGQLGHGPAARQLLGALPDTGVPGLSDQELALLRDWLSRITTAAPDTPN
ncbi:TetR/AcrR family transcriptional regulator [Saccharothrix coeruleofusca]|uniref:TetR family transcriptional regulator n=1 Tax=Saccharothrix coeruleofusca TaxID=33919 RepID=A0A918EEU5_9PSEU|nr:TetR/AcrR family transcriptional regulator [Saccharothrix coeruleofusca]GGP59175.1 TetR family transcriptional regulator [Saccharothrix coeruleofusca]